MEWNNDYKIVFFLFAFCPKKKLLPINLQIEKDNFSGNFFDIQIQSKSFWYG